MPHKAVIKTSFGTIYRDWELAPLPDLVFFQEGPGLRKWQWTDAGMKVINVTNILADGSVDTSNTSRYISLDEFNQRYSHFAVEDGDIVVASSGNTYGKVGRINRSHLPLMMNTSVIRFHPKSPITIDPDYLYAFLRSGFFKNQIEGLVIGSAQPNFGPAHLKQMKIIRPPYDIQKKIANIISAYDALIENNGRRINLLEEMARAIYRGWFVNFRFPGHGKVRKVDSLLGELPEGWAPKKFTEVICVNPTEHVSKETGKPYVAMEGLSTTSMLVTITEMRKGNSGSKFRNGDTLFPRITPCLENGKTGFVQFLASDDSVGIGSTEFIVLRSKTLCPEYVYLLSREESLRGLAIKSMSGASGRQRVDTRCFDKYLVAQPPKQTLDAFRRIVQPMFQTVHVLSMKNDVLRRTRDLLLPKLISGELDVEELDIATPDSEQSAQATPVASTTL